MGDTVDVLVGTIGRAHGLRGEVAVRVRTDEPERRFAPGSSIRVGSVQRMVTGSRDHSGTLLVRFEGVTDRSAAEGLRGLDVWCAVPVDEVPTEEDAYFDRSLVGLAVRDHTGTDVGRVVDVVHLPAHDSVVVRTGSGDHQVPFVEALVPVVDLDGGFLQIADVGGLLGEDDAEA